MSRDLDALTPEFKEKVVELLLACNVSGYEMRPFFTLRSPFDQGRLWRQSRSSQQIRKKLAELNGAGAHFLAHCIESVGPQNGRHVTNATPGLSWHQWGEAVDCFWLVDGGAEWSTRKRIDGVNGYVNYASIANKMGLDAGGLWRSFKDFPHVQLRSASNPRKIYSLAEIDAEMESRFSESGG